jgi:hypothetical protein
VTCGDRKRRCFIAIIRSLPTSSNSRPRHSNGLLGTLARCRESEHVLVYLLEPWRHGCSVLLCVDNGVVLNSTDSGLDAACRPADIDRFRRSPEYTRARTRSSQHRNFADLHKTSSSKELRRGTQIQPGRLGCISRHAAFGLPCLTMRLSDGR